MQRKYKPKVGEPTKLKFDLDLFYAEVVKRGGSAAPHLEFSDEWEVIVTHYGKEHFLYEFNGNEYTGYIKAAFFRKV